MRVGMQPPEPEDLLGVDIVEQARHRCWMDAGALERGGVGDLDALDKLRDEQTPCAQLWNHLRYENIRPMRERSSQRSHRLCLASKIELEGKGLVQVIEDRLELDLGDEAGNLAHDVLQDGEIGHHDAGDAGILHLDGDRSSVRKPRTVHLGDGGRSDRAPLDALEHVFWWSVQLALHGAPNRTPRRS